jgi:hypothetical protein
MPVAAHADTRGETAGLGVPTTTLVAHGFSTGDKGSWVEAMAKAILARAGGDGAVYRYTGPSGVLTRIGGDGGNGSTSNVVVVFNWTEDSGFIDEGPNWNYAQAAGDAMQAMLRDAEYAAGDAGPADLVTGRSVHFIAHSRGTVAISEAIKRLAVAGLPVDQMTTLDPHPVNGTLDARYDLDWGDPVPVRWANVAWADNVWRADGGGIFNGLDFDGIPIPNTFDIELPEGVLDCCAYGFAHSDTHLWYFGTVDLSPNPSNGEQTITDVMRNSWWPGGHEIVGFNRSAIGGGERPSIPPGVEPDPASVPILENGDFVLGSRAGWMYHGGLGANVAGGGGEWYARLDAARPALVHNRMYLPATGPGDRLRLAFDARRGSAGATDDLLRVSLERHDDAGPVALPGGVWPVEALDGAFAARSVGIPESFEGRTVLLRVEVADGENAIEGVVDVDRFSIEIVPAADLDGDGMVNGSDLAGLLGFWGTCKACPADLDGDGVVGGSDLAILLGTWGE